MAFRKDHSMLVSLSIAISAFALFLAYVYWPRG